MRCSRCGDITRSSPTPRNPSMPPISPIAATRSSRPCSPTSSTDPWPTCPRDASARTRPGSCAPRSPTTSSVQSACSPAADMLWPAEPPYGDASSLCRPDSPGLNADRYCTYPATGPGHQRGPRCGTTRSDSAHPSPSPPDQPPNRPNRSTQEKLDRPADTRCSQPERPTKPNVAPLRQLISGSRLSTDAPEVCEPGQTLHGVTGLNQR